MKKILHFLGIHIMNFKFSTGHNSYYECEICGKRDVKCPVGGYQPIDKSWLNKQNNF